MKIQDFKKIGGILKKAYAELDKEALAEGFDMLSPEYDQLVSAVRLKILTQHGFTLEEYQEAKNEFLSFKYLEETKIRDYDAILKEHENKIDEVSNSIPTRDDLIELSSKVAEKIAEKIAKKYIVPPKITNQIVERIIEKRPIKEVTKIKERVEYNDKKLKEQIKKVEDRIDEIKIPDEKQIKNDLFDALQKNLIQEIDILGMPDFRKLGMGIRGDLDALTNTVNSFVASENLWDRTGTTLTTHTAGDDISLTKNGILTTQTDAILLSNNTAAEAGSTVQAAPVIRYRSNIYYTSANHTIDWMLASVGGTNSSNSSLQMLYSLDGGAYNTSFTIQGLGYGKVYGTAAGFIINKTSTSGSSTNGLELYAGTAATSGVPLRYAPRITFTARAWNTTPTAASNSINFVNEVIPVSGATTSGSLIWSYDNNDSGYSEILRLTSAGNLGLKGGAIIYPSADSATSIQIMKADATTPVLNIDTTSRRIGIRTSAPSQALSFGGASYIWIENSAETTAGAALTVQSGSTIAGATTDVAGGNLVLNSGLGKGTGASSIIFSTGRTLTTGNTLQTLTTAMTILGSGNVGIGTTAPNNLLEVVGGTGGAETRVMQLRSNATDNNTATSLRFVNSTGSTSNAGSEICSLRTNTVAGDNDLIFRTSAAGAIPAEVMRIKAGGNIGLGTTAPVTKVHISAEGTTPVVALYNATADGLLITNNANPSAMRIVTAENGTATSGSTIALLRSRGTLASPLIVANGDVLMDIFGQGYDGSGRQVAGRIKVEVDGTPGATDMPGRITFLTTPDGSGTALEAFRISSNQTLSNTGAIGTAYIHLKAGTATASTAPLKFTTGTLLGTPEAGAIEFLTDSYYATITTGAARKTFAFREQRVVTTTDDATAAINTDITDVYELSAVANATVFTLTGTPVDGQKLIVRFKDAGVAKGLTWTGFTACGVTLPTTTVAGKWTYVGFVYNLAATAWHGIAVSTEA